MDWGSIAGNLVLGLLTDILPFRSLVFEVGILISAPLILVLNIFNKPGLNNEAGLFVLIFFLGFFINGSTIVIAAIECDIGKSEILKNN